MKKNFSKKLQAILKLAKEEAIRLGHSYVGSEHLLIGLLIIHCVRMMPKFLVGNHLLNP